MITHPLDDGTRVVFNPSGDRGTRRAVVLGSKTSSFGTLYTLRDEKGDVVEVTNSEIVGVRR